MERFRRLVLWSLMAVSTLLLFTRGHGSFQEKEPVAFLRENTSRVTVRVSGNVVNPGVYTFPCGTDIKTVILMTVPDLRPEKGGIRFQNRVLRDGDAIEIIDRGAQVTDILIKKMQVREMMVLGIPLDPNGLGVEEWECLPGIGPALAFRIVQDRQENGDFRSFRDLERVPGIGEKKIKQMAKYF
ncbi:MAG TPA: helix-hairpin-helix domain-containing protein [Geobacteraceae bacterium]|nr:helix-hairpin-helix domain-containing protein [Geobacteraceae bacterium]